jgi:imidazolonepropionase-like amidohydrolase
MRAAASCLLLTLAYLTVTNTVAAEPDHIVVVKARRLLDVVKGVYTHNPAVSVNRHTGQIVSLNEPPPQNAETIDLGDCTILPGLIDVHTHLSLEFVGDWKNRPVNAGPADDALTGVRNARVTLEAGFTTVRDLGSRDFVDVSLSKAVKDDLIVGPDITPCGHPLTITGGHFDAYGFRAHVLDRGPAEGVCDGESEATKAVREQVKHGARWIKVAATGGILSEDAVAGAQSFSEKELKAIVQEAARHGISVAAHAHGPQGIAAALDAGVASIEHGSVLDDAIIETMKRKGIYLVPTSYAGEYILRNIDRYSPTIQSKAKVLIPLMFNSHRRAIAAGVKIAFGTDAGVIPHGENAKEFSALVNRGMKPIEAIRSATINAAELLNLKDRGVIAPGLRADIVGVVGDPLVDVTAMQNVVFVMKHGVEHKKR